MNNTQDNRMQTRTMVLIIVAVAVLGVVVWMTMRQPAMSDQVRELGQDASTGVRDGYDATKDAVKDGANAVKDAVK